MTIQDFSFTGNINLNFFTFKDTNGIRVQNATFRINQDVYGYIFNGMQDLSKTAATKYDLAFHDVIIQTLSNSNG